MQIIFRDWRLKNGDNLNSESPFDMFKRLIVNSSISGRQLSWRRCYVINKKSVMPIEWEMQIERIWMGELVTLSVVYCIWKFRGN